MRGGPAFHLFEIGGSRYAIDPETCFCFECDAVSWDVLAHYPAAPAQRIRQLLREQHGPEEIDEVLTELEWLRATKAILPVPKLEDAKKQFDAVEGLQRVTLCWSARSETSLIEKAALFLLARSGAQKQLHFEVQVAEADLLRHAELIQQGLESAQRLGRLSGKTLRSALAVESPTLAAALPQGAAHRMSIRLEFGMEDRVSFLRELPWKRLEKPKKVAQLLRAAVGSKETPDFAGWVVVRPGSAAFQTAVAALQEAGFQAIELDVAGAHLQEGAAPEAITAELRRTAEWYAEQLLQRRYFRLEPVAALFSRIYEGKPLRRADPAGTQALAVNAIGEIYPSPAFFGQEAYRAGELLEGRLDEAVLRPFCDSGSLTTAVCLRCWARHLCGGGEASVHAALTSNPRTPSEAWCVAQRAWLESAVAAFNLLSNAGVNFTQLYSGMGRRKGVSLLSLARAAFGARVSVRPIAERDAEMLTRWENWSEAAYFLFHERGVFMATCYDREMDSLHPRDYEQEYVITGAAGAPVGLLRVRPDRIPGLAWAWLYFRKPESSQIAATLKALRGLLKQVGNGRQIQSVLVPTGPKDAVLAGQLAGAGAERAGEFRDGLYMHGGWHPVQVHQLKV